MSNQRNLIIAMLLTGLLLFGWDAGLRYFYPDMGKKPAVAASAAPTPAASAKPTREGGLGSVVDQAIEAKALNADLNAGGRVKVEAPGLSGSINLVGAVVDDLSINRHKQTIDKDSAPVRLFSPAGTPAEHFAQLGWVGQGVATPNGTTVWAAPAGAKLTPQTPVTLSWANTTGQTFTITFAIDNDYMITAKQAVQNAGPAPISVQPFGLIRRTEKTASVDSWNIHSGPFGAYDEAVNFGVNYKDVAEKGQVNPDGKTNWIGFTDIYWMSVLVPDAVPATGDYRSLGNQLFRADLIYQPQVVAPGQTALRATRLFAGAKESLLLDKYEAQGVTRFSLAIDWGWFRWFEKPIFWLLRSLFKFVGNFGVAIILLTVIVRGIMFPVAQRQFSSMAAMKAIQPKMKALQERYKDDKAKLQEETLKLYKEEGVNPLAGCLPIFLQIPVFFALYKVLMVSIDMRHQPFALWIHDLSAPDPKHILNLFGLLPFDPPSFLAIGVLAVILGITMWLQFKLQPAAPDPAQQQVMGIMPWMMMFIMAPFASGLLVYWITSNLLTIAQQKYLYARHPDLKKNVDKERAIVEAAAHKKK
ncbi:MAG: membrane protein insertase YidC [Novosphingobium sp. 63-713]|uniref:membrane protein insertase YidC n=1 Tax=unclassified Novosphingobium TaxID=2644732 RepID=UPI0008690A1C|nr:MULTISPECIES: membrane protein insertase YidC [unclassified Novosphingobium]MBN9145037.1 membrane protein insertase YidC [Novosphingobium sp.]MDR6708958.1 YidC/Oxa1 family membrane protein insertase [Novosphingobium sp. 1748]ODU71001.1 MAG: membrane protein insertase YidC [Novosphingobium sp. SCN 66-18]OJX89949.1 MAG: membrane protein insertase YidC [Novosphingobium sp. 63-713]